MFFNQLIDFIQKWITFEDWNSNKLFGVYWKMPRVFVSQAK